MADKEATVYIVDCGRSMGKKSHGRDISDFDWAMRYVWDRITSTVATGRKTATLGVVGLKTDGTDNELGSEESFENISVLQPISQILMPELRALKDKLHVSKIDDGDAISALVIAIQMISTYCKKLKYRRKIVLITNGLGDMDAEDTAQITDKIKTDDMELVILGVDFDDYDFGFKEEDKSKEKTSNERLLKTLADECDGVVGTLEQAVSELAMPRVKTVRPVPSFRGQLMLGDPSKYDSAMVINVERYPRTVIARPATSSQFVLKTDMAGQSSGQSSNTMEVDPEARGSSSNQNALSGVKNTRSYQVPDESAPGGKRDVERDELAKGYEYGRTAVAISESEENITKLETQAGLEIIGFVPKDKYERYMNLSQACVVIPAKANDKASMALSSLIHALWELESYAVARLVVKTDKSPVIVLLAPSIEPEYECLIDIQLPFAEDVRQYKFPPLDKVVTVSGKVLTEHRNLPNDALKAAMDSYVDSMDISSLGTDDEGNSTEYMPMDDTFSPVLHRIDQAVRWRAVRPLDPLPPVPEALTKYSNPPEELVAKTKSQLDKLIAAAEVKKVPPKQKGRKRFRDTQKPLSGLDVDFLLNRDRKRTKISSENAVPEFRQMLETTEDLGAIQDAANQLSQILRDYIKHSLGDSGYGRAVEALRVMRESLTELEEPAIYNSAIKDLKSKLQAEELGGDRKEMWWEIRKNRLGLITSKLSELSEVTEEEAQEFLAWR